MKNLSRNLKKHATKIISHEKKQMTPLTNEENKSYRKRKDCNVCNKDFSTKTDDKKYYKVRDYCHYTGKYRGAVHNVCNLRYKTPK